MEVIVAKLLFANLIKSDFYPIYSRIIQKVAPCYFCFMARIEAAANTLANII